MKKLILILFISIAFFACESDSDEATNIYIPTAFSPNNDGYNDCWRAVCVDVVDFNVKIVNADFILLFESNNINYCWDGTYNGNLLPDGTYFYTIKYSTINHGQKKLAGVLEMIKV